MVGHSAKGSSAAKSKPLTQSGPDTELTHHLDFGSRASNKQIEPASEQTAILTMAFPNRYQLPYRPPVPPIPNIPAMPRLPPIHGIPTSATAPPVTKPCLCLPLHWQCSPDTCATAGAGACEGMEPRQPALVAEWAIEMTIPELSGAVLRSCRTCTLIYTSLTTAGANVRWQPTSQIKVSFDGQLVFKPDPAEQHHYELDLLLDPTSCQYPTPDSNPPPEPPQPYD